MKLEKNGIGGRQMKQDLFIESEMIREDWKDKTCKDCKYYYRKSWGKKSYGKCDLKMAEYDVPMKHKICMCFKIKGNDEVKEAKE